MTPFSPHAEFAFGLHRLLTTEEPTRNLCWSPFSVASALGLVTEGARRRTRHELESALCPGGTLDDLAAMLAAAADLDDSTTVDGDRSQLAVANPLWTRGALPIEESYEATLRAWPGGALRVAPFADDPEHARHEINADVAKTTHGLIRDLLPAGAVSRETYSVLVNAIWLGLRWLHPFHDWLTRPRRFSTPTGERDVPTMAKQARLPYAAAGGWRMATLGAAGGLAVDILLPDQPGRPKRGANAGPPPMTAVELGTLRNAVTTRPVDLQLPRFDIAWGAQLNVPLVMLGIAEAFTVDADLSGISREPLKIDQVIHRATLRVDESGAEGAAATATVEAGGAPRPDPGEPVRFHADRPFLAVVRHVASGAIYFLTQVTEP